MTQNRDREVNFQKKSREFSRIDALAGHWEEAEKLRAPAMENWRYP